jgi:hypothetical protein
MLIKATLRMGLTGSPTNNTDKEITRIIEILRGNVPNSLIYPTKLSMFTIRRLKTDKYQGRSLTYPTPGILFIF